MNGNRDSQSASPLEPAEKTNRGTGGSVVEAVKEKIRNGNLDISQEAKTLGERVRKEVRERLGSIGDEMFDEDDSAEVEIKDEEEVIRGTPGLGALWKLSLCATISFAAYIFLSGPHLEPKWIPNITERDPIPKIYRPRNRRNSSSS